jgi:hypothetical protein
LPSVESNRGEENPSAQEARWKPQPWVGLSGSFDASIPIIEIIITVDYSINFHQNLQIYIADKKQQCDSPAA